jgi:hypothetical protein
VSPSFATDDAHAHPDLKPVRVPIRRETVYEEAVDLAGRLPGWSIASADDRTRVIVCKRSGGLLAPAATITIRVDGPEGLPSATVTCVSESERALFARDRRNVLEFMTPFHRRVG